MLVMCVACSISSAVAKLCLGCAGYLRHPFAELGVLRFIERASLSKHMIGTYNHSGSETLAVLSFCLGLWLAEHATYDVHLVRDLPFLSEEQQQSSKPTPKVTQRCTPLEVADWQARNLLTA